MADANFRQAEALKISIAQGRHDIALALIMGVRPPQRPGLDEAFTQLLEHPSINPRQKIGMVELLLCAGTDGDGPAAALLNAAASEFVDMVQVLVKYGASIEYQDSQALRTSITGGRVDVAHMLLSGNSQLSPARASECVVLIPQNMALEHRRVLLDQLLRRGATGEPLHNMLVEAAETGDLEAAKLLLTSQVPTNRQAGAHNLKKGPLAISYIQHAVASVVYKGGLPLQIAVLKGDVQMAKLMLSSKPSSDTLSSVFPATRTLSPAARYRMVECFLSSGLTGPSVHTELQEIISEKAPDRDENLVALFLKYNADVNANDGSALLAAVAQNDVRLLAALLRKNATPQTAVGILPKILSSSDARARLEMASLVLSAGASAEVAKVSAAMLKVLHDKPPDMKLLQILLQQGGADVNTDRGIVMASGNRPSRMISIP
jgi:ankyrin repeat protein